MTHIGFEFSQLVRNIESRILKEGQKDNNGNGNFEPNQPTATMNLLVVILKLF